MSFVGFNGKVTMSIDTIWHSVSVERAIVLINFIILNTLTSYNIILERLWIHKKRVFPSTYLQLVKYLMVTRIKEIKGDHKKARSCYNVAIKNLEPSSSSR